MDSYRHLGGQMQRRNWRLVEKNYTQTLLARASCVAAVSIYYFSFEILASKRFSPTRMVAEWDYLMPDAWY